MRSLAKSLARSALAAPGVRHGLRWFLHQRRIPDRWREVAHSKLAKRADFGDRTFSYVTSQGVRLVLAHVGSPNYLYWQGEYEPETMSLFTSLAARSTVILDIGAADGIYALFAAAANPDARVVAFEPGASAAGVFKRNCALNADLARRIELHQLALGERDETATLYVSGRTGGTSSLNPEFRAVRREETVSVRRGDALLAELGIGRVDLVKLDTESTEPAVLRGLRATLERDRPDLICEVLHTRTERALEAILQPLGYQYIAVTKQGLVKRDRIEADPTFRYPNYFFNVRPDRA